MEVAKSRILVQPSNSVWLYFKMWSSGKFLTHASSTSIPETFGLSLSQFFMGPSGIGVDRGPTCPALAGVIWIWRSEILRHIAILGVSRAAPTKLTSFSHLASDSSLHRTLLVPPLMPGYNQTRTRVERRSHVKFLAITHSLLCKSRHRGPALYHGTLALGDGQRGPRCRRSF